MKYIFDCDRWGSFFSVPSKVVDDYLKISDGNFVKVLLCILSSCDREIDIDDLAQRAGVSEDAAEDAVTHWVNLGVITAVRADGKAVSPAFAITQPELSAVQSVPASVVESVNPTKSAVLNKLVIRYRNSEILEKAEKDANLKNLFNEIQSVLQYTINSTEQGELLALYEYYHFDVASILLAAEYCVSLDKRRVSYLVTVMKRWYEEDICTYAQIEAEIIRCTELKSFENRILKIFGVTAKPSKQQQEYISKWRSMGFTPEMLEIAYNKCMDNTNKLNFKYIDTILMNWAGKSISTPQQVSEEDKKFKSNSNKCQPATQGTSYNLDDFENFAMNFDLSKSGKL